MYVYVHVHIYIYIPHRCKDVLNTKHIYIYIYTYVDVHIQHTTGATGIVAVGFRLLTEVF